ncbi:MAG: hypothetical protein M3406_03620 [Chloroflexota bacterium]|nr:hypothetical protein [Chloroflexota bacterium]
MSETILTGFGDVEDYTAFAPFHVEVDAASGVYPDWEQELIAQTRHIPGSNRSDTFISGFGVASLTLAVWFDDRDAYRRFRPLYVTTATLRVFAQFTSHEGAIQHLRDGDPDYEDFANTTLIQVTRPLHQVDGVVEVQVTFQRGFDPVTGLAVT